MAKIGVVAGRFCPPHAGHMRVIGRMVEECGVDRSLVIIGSCASPLSFRVLFGYSDRKRWLRRVLPKGLRIIGTPDYPGDDPLWVEVMFDQVSAIFPEVVGPRADYHPGPVEVVFYGGSEEDVAVVSRAGFATAIVDRNGQPCSATNVRQLLLNEEPVSKFVDKRIEKEVVEIFRKQLKKLDELR
jgi:phosphopantetheine adenylyltransferase